MRLQVLCLLLLSVFSGAEDSENGEVTLEDEDDDTWSATRPVYDQTDKGGVDALRKRFSELDLNGDGAINPTELEESDPKFAEERVKKYAMLVLDSNGDGQVTEEEFVNVLRKPESNQDTWSWLKKLKSRQGVITVCACAVVAFVFLLNQYRQRSQQEAQEVSREELQAFRQRRFGGNSPPSSPANTISYPSGSHVDGRQSQGKRAKTSRSSKTSWTSGGKDDSNANGKKHPSSENSSSSGSEVVLTPSVGRRNGSSGSANEDYGNRGEQKQELLSDPLNIGAEQLLGSHTEGNQVQETSSKTAGLSKACTTSGGDGDSKESGKEPSSNSNQSSSNSNGVLPTSTSAGGSNGSSGSGSGGDEDGDGGERKRKLLCDSSALDQADEEDKGEETGEEMTGSTAESEAVKEEDQAVVDQEPAAKRHQADDLRRKRLARFQSANTDASEKQPGSLQSVCQTEAQAVATSQASTVDSRSAQPVALKLPEIGSASKEQLVSTKLPASPAVVDPVNAVAETISALLDMKIVINETKARAVSGNIQYVRPSELPDVSQDVHQKVQQIYMKRISRELDPVRYCLSCFDRAERYLPPATTAASLCTAVAADVLDMSINVVLDQLIENCQGGTSDDLWSQWSGLGNGEGQGVMSQFLSRLTGHSSDGVSVSPNFLTALLNVTSKSQHAQKAVLNLIHTGGERMRNVKRLDELSLQANYFSPSIKLLLNQPAIVAALRSGLENEQQQGEQGSYFEKSCTLSPFLCLSSITWPFKPNSPRLACFHQLPHFPSPSGEAINSLQTHILNGVHTGQSLVHTALLKMLKQQDSRECALSWLSTLFCMNQLRAAAQFRGQQPDTMLASDGFMVNSCAVMLQLCQPFFTSVASDRLTKIQPSYPRQPYCRLDLHNEPCLAGTRINAEEKLAQGNSRFRLSKNMQGQANFLTECFHLTQYALHVGLMPVVRRFIQHLQDLGRMMRGKSGKELEELQKYNTSFAVSWSCCLLDPVLARQCCEFYITQAVWLKMLLDQAGEKGGSEADIAKRQQDILLNVVEFSIKDMANWISFVVQHKSSALQGLQLTTLVDCCVTLLERQDLLPSPLAQTRLVELLLVFVETTDRSQRNIQGWGSGIRSELAAIVHTCPTVQEQLGPALLHTFAAVDVIEGLDVDKEDFDKFGARHTIQRLLEQLWSRHDCRRSILNSVRSSRFPRFLNGILDTVIYQLNDALRRLWNVRQLQNAQKDEEAWGKLSHREREEKLQFLANEEGVGSSFMKMATKTLHLLDMMTEEEEVAALFRTPPLSVRAAAAVVEFIDSLCGGQSSELKVKDMDKMNFNPKKLLASIVSISVRMAGLALDEAAPETTASASAAEINKKPSSGFVVSLAEHPDYTKSTMAKAGRILQRDAMLTKPAVLAGWEALLEEVAMLIESRESTDTLTKLEVMVEETDDSQCTSTDVVPGGLHTWQEIIEAEDICKDGIEMIYVDALKDARFDDCEGLSECHALQSNFIDQPMGDPRSPKLRALMKEVKQLSDNLPIHAHSSIFVRQDDERMDVVRALITGPADTPYSLGCFAFDIYFPASYPTNPPLVKLITTGNGTVRFNPNLYADGKVCLSLLGTWHGGDATEKWDPASSSLFQVLVSIQGMILIPDPMYNEPGYERIRGTTEGNERSRHYNAGIRLATVRHAMFGQLCNPPQGFEDVIKVHFTIQKDAVLLQLSQWLRESKSPDEERKLRRAVDQLRVELEKL